jgi:hypothetical protein
MKTKDKGLAAVALAPSIATTTIDGAAVEAKLTTDYPFHEKLNFTIITDKPARFPLYLRIPAWAADASVLIEGTTIFPEAGKFFKIQRQWQGKTQLLLTLPMKPKATRRHNNSIAIERGPLVYALKIPEKWNAVNVGRKYREPPHGDWEVYPTGPWNYALDVTPETLEQDITFTDKPVGNMPFSPDGAPVVAHAKGVLLPDWKMVNGSVDQTPKIPVTAEGPLQQLTLIPYGCTNIRITEFPTLK